MGEAEPEASKGDLSVTALYTSYTWHWAGLKGAELFETPQAKAVFGVTNLALAVAKLFMWRLKSLKHSLLHRHTMIDHVLTQSGLTRVIELAAGLSRRGAAFSEDVRYSYTEVDLAHMIAHKETLLDRSDAGKAVRSRPNLRRISADVTQLDLTTLNPDAAPAVVIAEGLLMYLKPDQQRTLWRRIAELLSGGGTFVFDLVPWIEQPKPGPIGRALEWLMKKFTKGQSFARDQRTREDLKADLQAAGFDAVEALEPADVAEQWSLPHPRVRTQQVVFICQKKHDSERSIRERGTPVPTVTS